MAEVFSVRINSDHELNFPPTYIPNSKFTYFALKSSERKYYLKHNPYGSLNPNNIFP